MWRRALNPEKVSDPDATSGGWKDGLCVCVCVCVCVYWRRALNPEKVSEPDATSGGWKAGLPRVFEHVSLP